MKILEINNRMSELFQVEIEFLDLINQKAKKWYEKEYVSNSENEFKDGFTYGIKIYGIIRFDFNVKSIDSLFKSFYTNFINKYFCAKYDHEAHEKNNSYLQKYTKERAKEIVSNYFTQDRVYKGLMYSTQYGIGLWSIFMTIKSIETNKKAIETILNEQKIQFKNEYSEAGWVYRYKLLGNYLDHNEILKQVEIRY